MLNWVYIDINDTWVQIQIDNFIVILIVILIIGYQIYKIKRRVEIRMDKEDIFEMEQFVCPHCKEIVFRETKSKIRIKYSK